ncbi:nitrite/sulfite reductase [Siccirubricoccus sp. KC 17139]|uniref:Nitrite/sulfite reductase n=1 Tax=Siccirubricoccus soli TaxID=2899147 RepID=A0ABT1DBV3_9PROT|nr:nitrite/sulfite reductase [Siccirubricoccus soli]MCO6419412.1 nitrite/sulfite reductase [Siccirubricoccus soli]MCP2685547.1 nitrite/sulfite reductase [Siccirubricoccus soli]
MNAIAPRPAAPIPPHARTYRYDAVDREFLAERIAEFEGQVQRRLAGELTEEEFKPLRLMNGLYLQLHAYMLRIAIPYGVLNAAQLRQLAYIARRWDRGFGHFTTRQNIQFNWTKLEDVPDILRALAAVDMHAIQTSGNCIRNVTTDEYAGASPDEVVDPRIYAEILRQWSTLHPEFTWLPRKFKIAITGAPHDRVALQVHDIGLEAKRNAAGEVGFAVHAGGGLGRTPLIATKLRDFLPEAELLGYLEAILRTYNALGQRDNIYKARIKILVRDLGADFAKAVEEEYARLPRDRYRLDPAIIAAIRQHFAPPPFLALNDTPLPEDPAFRAWAGRSVRAHKRPGYASVTISLKPIGGIPGDASAEQMEAVARLAERFSFGEIRVSHVQNLVLPHVRQEDLAELWDGLREAGLAAPNIGLVSDIIACPGMDYCALATARSIPVAQRISERFADLDRQLDIGECFVNISGCINACGHHHVGHIGILGVDKRGEEVYQVTLGGSATNDAALGELVGPAFSYDDVVDAVETILRTHVAHRLPGERFIDCYRRIGLAPFKEALYAAA